MLSLKNLALACTLSAAIGRLFFQKRHRPPPFWTVPYPRSQSARVFPSPLPRETNATGLGIHRVAEAESGAGWSDGKRGVATDDNEGVHGALWQSTRIFMPTTVFLMPMPFSITGRVCL